MSKHAPGIYVEILIRGTMEELWEKTQDPDLHERWDLRFSQIEYLPKVNASAPQQFLYATRIGFGLNIQGRGESVGELAPAQGQRTSALKFWSDDWKSLIRQGSGYWKYTPQSGGIQFETGYDYDVRFGLLGEWTDRLLFRPLIGWATAWSFDRLRLWIQDQVEPSDALLGSLKYAVARILFGVALFIFGLVLFGVGNGNRFLEVGGSAAVLGLALLWVWRTRALRAKIPFARHCRRQSRS